MTPFHQNVSIIILRRVLSRVLGGCQSSIACTPPKLIQPILQLPHYSPLSRCHVCLCQCKRPLYPCQPPFQSYAPLIKDGVHALMSTLNQVPRRVLPCGAEEARLRDRRDPWVEVPSEKHEPDVRPFWYVSHQWVALPHVFPDAPC